MTILKGRKLSRKSSNGSSPSKSLSQIRHSNEKECSSSVRLSQSSSRAQKRSHSTTHCVKKAKITSPNLNSESALSSEYYEAKSLAYNSEDEYENSIKQFANYTPEELKELEMHFAKVLNDTKGFVIRPMKEDGNCLFRAIADQVFGDQELHHNVRRSCMDYIGKNKDFFGQYITEDISHYLARKRNNHVHGNYIEMIALTELYNRPLEIYQYTDEPINTFQPRCTGGTIPLRVSFHVGSHYNSVIDPHNSGVGLGLGLPSFVPGSIDDNLLRHAAILSEQHHIEKAMLDDKINATDWEATDEEMVQQAVRESYLEWLREHEVRQLEGREGQSEVTDKTHHYMKPAREMLKENSNCEGSSKDLWTDYPSSSGFVGMSNEYSNWCESALIEKVIFASQQEYFDSLKKVHEVTTKDDNPTSTINASSDVV